MADTQSASLSRGWVERTRIWDTKVSRQTNQKTASKFVANQRSPNNCFKYISSVATCISKNFLKESELISTSQTTQHSYSATFQFNGYITAATVLGSCYGGTATLYYIISSCMEEKILTAYHEKTFVIVRR